MPSKTDIWMPLYIGDYLADTSHLDAERHGCYLLWMMHYWRKGPLVNDLNDLVSIGRLRGKDASSIAQALLAEFFTMNGDGRWHQKRQDVEREKWQQKKLSALEKAKKAAAGRWNNASSIDQAMLKQFPSPLPSSLPSPASLPKEQVHLPPAVIRLPATGGKEYAVTQNQVTRWKELYPAVDVMQDLRAMVGWLEADPKRRKTTSGMNRFINNWLAKSQNGNRGGYSNGKELGSHNLDVARRFISENCSGLDAVSNRPPRDDGQGDSKLLFLPAGEGTL